MFFYFWALCDLHILPADPKGGFELERFGKILLRLGIPVCRPVTPSTR